MTVCSRNHRRRHTFLHLAFYFLIGSSLIVFTGCGGGGGGSSNSSENSTGISYSGMNTQAEITSENSTEIVASAYTSGNKGLVFTGVAGLTDADQIGQRAGNPFLLNVSRLLEGAVEKIDLFSVSGQNLSAALETESGTIAGNCGGSASYSIQVESVTGTFSGSLSFIEYCEDGTQISGPTTFNGVVNISTEQLLSFTISFDNISETSGADSFAMDGDIEFDISSPSITMSMNMLVKDNNLDKVYKLENYQITIIDNYTYTSIDVSGTFFDPDYGFVTISTPLPFLANYNQDYPYSGQLVLIGKDGAAGEPTSVRLNALSATSCQVEADTDGDGQFDDYDSGVMLWTEL